MRSDAAAIVLLALLGTVAGAQLPDGYRLGAKVTLPDSVLDVRHSGRFRLTSQRVFKSESEERMIALAERLLPPREAIVSATRAEKRPSVVERLHSADARPGERWWWEADDDGTWTPYAVTGAAVAYYIDHWRALSEHPTATDSSDGNRRVVTFGYRATVTPVAPTADGAAHFRVRLELEWYWYCGPLCAEGFKHWREVDFAADGRVIAIRGDGRPSIWMS